MELPRDSRLESIRRLSCWIDILLKCKKYKYLVEVIRFFQ